MAEHPKLPVCSADMSVSSKASPHHPLSSSGFTHDKVSEKMDG